MSRTPIKPLSAQLLQLIGQFLHEMRNPQFKIEYGDVTTYIVSSAPCDDGPITTPLLSDILSRHMGYAPTREFTRNLMGASIYDTDLECMAVLYSLLMMDHLPPSGLRVSIIRILYSDNGEDLERHLVDNLDDDDSDWLKAQLERIS
ncbi:hypothetical protein N7516_008931 [Penicillium verrucosum]|uniref:uncharacterized protein n=1 Tax=Penicillium verrucosum TaxID=60171 RepID=UPI0025459D92|nr:uncharacterized protein N7516_008931 [Penicillium verrucosum]KAJ5927158.1 hypothetical protein N7516_008931 [Penicillium verrucosum]